MARASLPVLTGRAWWAGLWLAAIVVGPCAATERARWEFGIGTGVLAFADYRGADSYHVYPLPLPYFIYRGRILRADRNGVHGRLFSRQAVEINLSLNATTPVHSRHNQARLGMPDLKPTIEVGPALDLHLWQSSQGTMRLDLRAPLRAALTLEAVPRSIGWFFAPTVNVDISGLAGHRGWQLGVQSGPLFADRRYHDYFYGVAPAYVTANRSGYQARGGYSGTQMVVALSKRYSRHWIGAFVRYDTLSGAVFAASPLVRTHSYWTFGAGVAWQLGESSHRVEVQDTAQ